MNILLLFCLPSIKFLQKKEAHALVHPHGRCKKRANGSESLLHIPALAVAKAMSQTVERITRE